MPRSKEYLKVQAGDGGGEKLPDLVSNTVADPEELREQVQSLQIGGMQGFLTGLFGENMVKPRAESAMDLGDFN